MCTVSWIHEDDGYQLFCNRDERHTRRPALSPRIAEQRGVRFIAPVDGDHGGSWIGVNQFGLSLCLLNRYQGESRVDAPVIYTSRGLLLNELMNCRSRDEVPSRIEAADLTRYQPFTLLALEPESSPLVLQWTGRECVIERSGEVMMPLTSSSFDPPGVSASRHQHFNNLVAASGKIDAHLLYRFHSNHSPAASAYSTCMHRYDARTVSFSRIKVTRRDIEFYYHPNSACTSPHLKCHDLGAIILERHAIESVPRAVMSVASTTNSLQDSRSLPLAALIQRIAPAIPNPRPTLEN